MRRQKVTHANNPSNPFEEEEELRKETTATGDKADEENEEELEVFRKMIDAVENHDTPSTFCTQARECIYLA
jgi:hypothetical protein